MKPEMLALGLTLCVGVVFAQEAAPAAEDTVQEKCTVEEKTVQDMIDEFLNSKGWVAGENVKNGKKFFIATGTGVIQAPRSKPSSYVNSRVNAYNKAMLEAKKNMVEFLGIAIETETQKSYEEGDMTGGADGSAAETDPNSIAGKLKALVHANLDKALKASGVDPADKKAAAEATKKLLAQESYKKVVRSCAQAQVVGLQSICTFEGVPGSDKGEIGVVAIWSPKLQEMAESMLTGRAVSKVKAKKPIRDQIASDPGALLSTFGVQQKIDEQGDLVLVSFGQAGGVSESKMAAKGAQSKAKQNAMAAIREFAGENVAVASDMLNAESTKEFEDAAEEYQDASAFKEKINATAARMNIAGISVVKNWRFKHPITGTMVYGTVCAWAPKQAASANMMRQKMADAGKAKPAPAASPAAATPAVRKQPKPTASSYNAGGQSGDEDAF